VNRLRTGERIAGGHRDARVAHYLSCSCISRASQVPRPRLRVRQPVVGPDRGRAPWNGVDRAFGSPEALRVSPRQRLTDNHAEVMSVTGVRGLSLHRRRSPSQTRHPESPQLKRNTNPTAHGHCGDNGVVHHRRDRARHAATHRPARRRPPRHQHHHGIQEPSGIASDGRTSAGRLLSGLRQWSHFLGPTRRLRCVPCMTHPLDA
jgi:hypothetical protein